MPGGLRLGRHNGDLAAYQRIDQGRFADIGPPDNGNVAGAKIWIAHAGPRISAGSRSMTLAAANCSARRRLAPSPLAPTRNTGTSHITVKDCACGSPPT